MPLEEEANIPTMLQCPACCEFLGKIAAGDPLTTLSGGEVLGIQGKLEAAGAENRKLGRKGGRKRERRERTPD